MQTASWLSFLSYGYLTPLVIKGYKQPHLGVDDLPPISDRDKIETMVQLHYAVCAVLFYIYITSHISVPVVLRPTTE